MKQHRTHSRQFTLGTVTGEGILKIEVLDGCAQFGQIVIRKSENSQNITFLYEDK